MKRNLYLLISLSAIAAILMFTVMGIYRLMSNDQGIQNKIKMGNLSGIKSNFSFYQPVMYIDIEEVYKLFS